MDANSKNGRQIDQPNPAVMPLMQISTEQVMAQERQAFWADLVCAHLVQAQCSLMGEPGRFRGHIVQRALPEMSISNVRASAQRVIRTPEFISRAGDELLMVVIQREGRGAVRQGGREAQLSCGEMTIFSSAQQYELAFDGDFWQTVLLLPASSLRPLAPHVDGLIARRLRQEEMASSTLTQFAEALMALPEATPSVVGAAACDGLLHTLAAGCNGLSHAGVHGRSNSRSLPDAHLDSALALDALDMGVMLLSTAAQLLMANRRAKALLSQASGVQSIGGNIVIRGMTLTGVRQLLARVVECGESEGLTLRDANGTVTHALTMRAATPDHVAGHLAPRDVSGKVLVFIKTPGQQRAVAVKQLMQMFGLTHAEARLAHELAEGASVDTYQEAHGVKAPTVRTQLQSLMRKTGTHRQQDLIRLLACLPTTQ